jgi:hypothetical protein
MSKTTKKTANENQSLLELAEATLRTLEQKRARLAAKRAEDDREVEAISYQLHTGDQDARQRYEAIRERKIRRESDLQSLDAAIVTAKAKLEEAKADERAENQRQVAIEARGLVQSLRDAGTTCDDALATFAARPLKNLCPTLTPSLTQHARSLRAFPASLISMMKLRTR